MIDLRSNETHEFAIDSTIALIAVEILIMYPAIVLGVSSILNGTPFFTWSTLAKIIGIDLLHAILVYVSEYALNVSRWLLFYPWIKYLAPVLSQWETYLWPDDSCPLFYIDFSGYTSLTEYFDDHLARAKSKKDDGPDERTFFKFAKKSKRNIMASVPNAIKRLVENDCLEIRTRPCTYLSHQHFRMMYDHTIATEASHDSQTASSFWEILSDTAVIMQMVQLGAEGGVMDEFYLNGKLVAFQTSTVMGNVLIDGMWAVLPEARKLSLYFEGMRLLMKRAIADPSVEYMNLQVMDLEKESLCLPKRKMFAREIVAKSDEDLKFCAMLCGFPDYIVSFENLGLWLDMFGSIRLGEKFWNVKDESDLY